ncbi:type IV secretory system conjugative DNA transfer family protein [Paracraurococcus lichenis]|uniref:Type IV secretory system conjugative DNA transfer family protein n=1 Tax=Paracraurococcus lichenis TaxID=3064888 RepID=A0ABT9E6J5_9PROT|nr:type IV secretory system conjugative DNA transfer family protein [Paracraurococcus sp. LOR1-02]MDO9711774.1 type IV secretory system conjugative DNA transfer family protein [Paracraurococcus sp. LOR1-02]
MNAALKALAEATLGSAAVAAAWTAGASAAFLGITGLWGQPAVPGSDYLWGWWRYLPHAGRNTTVALGLVLSGAAVGLPLLSLAGLAARWRWRSVGGLRGVGQRMGLGQIRRGTSNNHGRADWMSEARIERLFPPHPHPEIGGVVVGERSRDDLSPQHALPFDPRDPDSWGLQGRGPLMFDHCERGTTHSLIIGGGGTYKSTTLTTTLLHWRPSTVILDPARELHAKLAGALADSGKTVLRLDLGAAGPNVLEAIDLASPEGRLMADSRLRGVASRVIGPMPRDDSGNAGRFKRWGRAIVLALLADLVHREDVPAGRKTLCELRRGLDVPSERLRDRLRGVYEGSASGLARSMAANVMDLPEETWGGAVGNAMEDTEWLATEAYANLVSGNALRMRDIVRGRHAIFVQIPQEVLQVTPGLARVLIGGLLDAVLAQEGRVVGRVGFFIDEAVLLGPEPSLKLARDQGRKSKVTLQLFYQSEGQIEDVWGKAQRDAWFDGVSFRSYTRVQNVNTARDLVTALGTFGARAESRGNSAGSSGRPLEWASRQRGDSAQESEIARELMKPHELLQEMRANERITIVANDRPIRHLSAIDFCRPEIAARLGQTDYQARFAGEDLESAA